MEKKIEVKFPVDHPPTLGDILSLIDQLRGMAPQDAKVKIFPSFLSQGHFIIRVEWVEKVDAPLSETLTEEEKEDLNGSQT